MFTEHLFPVLVFVTATSPRVIGRLGLYAGSSGSAASTSEWDCKSGESLGFGRGVCGVLVRIVGAKIASIYDHRGSVEDEVIKDKWVRACYSKTQVRSALLIW